MTGETYFGLTGLAAMGANRARNDNAVRHPHVQRPVSILSPT